MEKISVNPQEIMLPQSLTEKIAGSVNPGEATGNLIQRLKGLETTVTFSDGETMEVTLDKVREYIDHEAYIIRKYYPPDFRYNEAAQALRTRTLRMEETFKKGDYPVLIKILMAQSVRFWNAADKLDANMRAMPPEELARAKKIYQDNLEEEKRVTAIEKETGIKQEHGIPPFMLEVGGDSERDQSRLYLAFAVVLAKSIK